MGTDDLRRSRGDDSARKHLLVTKAIEDLSSEGFPFSVQSVSTSAGVHRSFIYRHPELREMIAKAEVSVRHRASKATRKSVASLEAENLTLKAANGRALTRLAALETKLSELLGDKAYRSTGMGADAGEVESRAEIETLRHAARDLEHKLSIAYEDLAAAREMNRQLLYDMNRSN